MRHALLILIAFSGSTLIARAGEPNPFPRPDDKVKGDILTGPKSVIQFIDVISDWIFAILIAISVIYILIAAYTYMSSKGGEGVESAHKMLMYAAVGIVVAVLAKGIVFTIRKVVDSNTPQPKTSQNYTHEYLS